MSCIRPGGSAGGDPRKPPSHHDPAIATATAAAHTGPRRYHGRQRGVSLDTSCTMGANGTPIGCGHPRGATASAGCCRTLDDMEVRIGPVPAASAVAWVGYARRVLAGATNRDDPPPGVEPDSVEEFSAYLDTWEAEAAGGDPFIWAGELEPERLEYLTHCFLRIVDHLSASASARGTVEAPPEGEAFYQALVSGIINALAAEGDSAGAYSEDLRSRWPGLRGT